MASNSLDLNKLIPSSLKNETLSSLVSNLFNRFLSEEKSIFINGRVGRSVLGDPQIQQQNLDRELNALVPAVYVKTGTEENVFTFDDFINRLNVLNADVDGMKQWMAEVSYNYSLPINYDKFVNYSNYYWVGQQLETELPANPNADPEFYVIGRPEFSDLVKMPVDLATTSNIQLYAGNRPPETFTFTFISTTVFTVTSNFSGTVDTDGPVFISPAEGDETLITLVDGSLDLCRFIITAGTTPFSAGDTFTLNIKYYTSEIYVNFTSANIIGKGTLSGTKTELPLQMVDGVQIAGNERVLVCNQTDPSENGIYIATIGNKWQRGADFNTEEYINVGTAIYVEFGSTYSNSTFNVTSVGNGVDPFELDDMAAGQISIDYISNTLSKPVNVWQEINHWIHRDDFQGVTSSQINFDTAIQATRPIIEYHPELQLNSSFDALRNPDDSTPGKYTQEKTRFNQIPQFDIYRYDGTHHGSTSGIFFYVEDPDFTTDSILRKRVKTTADNDYVFATGLRDDLGRLLYYKQNGELRGIWQQGPSAAEAINIKFAGGSNRGQIAIDSLSSIADNQSWAVTATSSSEFSVTGTRSGAVGTAAVGVQFECDDLKLTISNGINPFEEGESFTFSVVAPVSPRYVKKDSEQIINYPGGPVGDRIDNAELEGVWLTPARMFQNLERELRSEISFGDIINHLRSVIRNQDGFTGVSFGNNNYRNLPGIALGNGGTIREFSSNFPLLASMLIQKDVSPLTILDFAEQQYIIALSSIDQFILNELPAYVSETASVTTASIDATAPDILALEKAFEQYRASNTNLKDVFGDTTCLVSNWPVTLPMIGMMPTVTPGITFDHELGIFVIVHHDGHSSPIAVRDNEFDRNLVKAIVNRSDGTKSPGTFSESMPVNPYARLLWIKPSTFELKIFDVAFDTDAAPTGTPGQFWYKRSSNTLYEWDAIGNAWLLSSSTVASRWTIFDSAAIRNSLMLAVENRLKDSVHPAQQLSINLLDAQESEYAEVELARYSAKYQYDAFGSEYVASNAFTWNYKQAVIPGLSPVPARWYDIYNQYFDNPGFTLPTSRPNIEPWKLLNFSTRPVWWDSTYLSTIEGSSNIVSVKAVATSNIPVLNGNPTVDGITLSNGDRVLLTGQSISQLNGLYTVNNAGWSRTSDILTYQLTVKINDGYEYAGTTFTLTTNSAITVGLTPLAFEQVRIWLRQMWLDIKAANPGLKLCVNTATEQLIPPYVSSGLFASGEALLTAIPASVSSNYEFGDNGPVETVWKKSLEYLYGISRSYFRLFPLKFLDKTWGETYISAGANLRTERNLMASLPSSKFLMHGERLNLVNQYTELEIKKRVKTLLGGSITWANAGDVVFEVTHCADNTTVFYAYINNSLIGMVYEGVPFTVPTVDGITITNVVIDDLGIPFELGEKITIKFFDNTVVYEVLDEDICEGCYISEIQPGIISNTQNQPTFSHVPATVKRFKGIGQWFTNLLRYSYIDTDMSNAANSYRKWDLKLAHRIGALIRQDTLTVNTTQGSLPTTAYDVILKRSAQTESIWHSAVRVQLINAGSKRLNADALFVPSNDASDWTFRVEVYNPQHPQVERYVVDTASSFQTFFALQKQRTDREWKRYTNHTALVETLMPQTITGLQNVCNFLYGYIDRLEELNWQVNKDDEPVTDAETGRNLDWQLEVEKLIDRVYGGISANEGHILNPSMSKIVLGTPIGLMSRYTESNFIDVYSTQACFDVTGVVIPINNLTVVRTDERCVTYSQTPIFSAHVFIDEFEHTILMNKRFSEENASATIFDPFLGSSIDSAYLSFIKQDSLERKPTFDGFFLSGNNVVRNISSSISNIGNYYDAGQTFLEPITAQHGLALLGFTSKDYFSSVNVNDTTQFNFWRGLIQAKGTNMTIDAFVNYKKFNSAAVDEYWAYKIATYGDARERTFPELKLLTSDVTQKFARFQFYSADDTTYSPLPLFSQIENADDSRWYSIDDLGNGLNFEALQIKEKVTVPASAQFPAYIRLTNIFHTGDSMGPVITGPSGALIIGASLVKIQQSGTYEVSGYTWVNPTKHSPIKLFDFQNSDLVDEIGLWHPAIGIHSSTALEIVNIISKNDAAQYNYTTKTTNNVNYRKLKPWAEREVGRVWWDTSNLGYVPYYDSSVFPNRDTRESRWGTLAEWASVDLYQWTESSVPPSEYDALSAAQEGDYEIDQSVRASGKAALRKYYSRDRIIQIRPIAWSSTTSGNGNAHPAFGLAEFTPVYYSGSSLIPDRGRTSDLLLTTDKHFGAWKDGKPVGEAIITGEIAYLIGSSTDINLPVLSPVDVASGIISAIRLDIIPGSNFGGIIGQINIHALTNTETAEYSIRMMDSSGFYEDVLVNKDWFSGDLVVNSETSFEFNQFGLRLVLVRETTGSITSEDLVAAATGPFNDIVIREAVRCTPIIPLPEVLFVNDENDPLYSTTEYEWRCWAVPTQDDLDKDLSYPFNSWNPYIGDLITVAATADLVEEMNNSSSTYILTNGISINRFNTYWTDWDTLNEVKIETISNGLTNIEFLLDEELDVNRTSIYSNGIQLNPSNYEILNNTVKLLNILPEGSTVLFLYRTYQPTEKELAFDPAVREDFAVQTQYKIDYQHTKIDTRDDSGNINGAKYYFWVQDKTISQTGKNMSLAKAKNLLKNGPSSYMLFSRLQENEKFDSCAIAGLGNIVTQNNAYKLRFLRNFTLRDDPEELKLKNVHTEWALLRRSQSAAIPKSLWDRLTDAVCGTDIGGNPLPSQVRVDYDQRNGTRSRFGFNPGQIFAETELVKASLIYTILNTSLTIKVGNKVYPDYIVALNIGDDVSQSQINSWFAQSDAARQTMNTIWNTARPKQINELFFSVLDDALSNNYEFSDLFKTSYITVSSQTVIEESKKEEQEDGIF